MPLEVWELSSWAALRAGICQHNTGFRALSQAFPVQMLSESKSLVGSESAIISSMMQPILDQNGPLWLLENYSSISVEYSLKSRKLTAQLQLVTSSANGISEEEHTQEQSGRFAAKAREQRSTP